MNTNMPTLYQNILFGLTPGIEHDAFLWAVERPGEDRYCYRAEAFAREVGYLLKCLEPMVDKAAEILGEQQPDKTPSSDQKSDLMKFILTRHANWRYGGNVKPEYV